MSYDRNNKEYMRFPLPEGYEELPIGTITLADDLMLDNGSGPRWITVRAGCSVQNQRWCRKQQQQQQQQQMKLDKNKVYQIEWRTKAQLTAIASFFYSLGYSYNDHNLAEFIERWHKSQYYSIPIYPNRKEISGNNEHRSGFTTITMNDLCMFDTAPIEVKLSENYKALVTKENIQVGCQTFTHAAAKELYEASIKIQTA